MLTLATATDSRAALAIVAAMKQAEGTYYACYVRWQQANGFLLWQNSSEPGREAVWADAQGYVPLFKTQPALAGFVRQLGCELVDEQLFVQKLDAVASWLNNTKKRPARECLSAWNLFDEVGASVGEPFAGSHKTPLRNRVFDLLYADSGPWQRSVGVYWPLAEQDLLRKLLT